MPLGISEFTIRTGILVDDFNRNGVADNGDKFFVPTGGGFERISPASALAMSGSCVMQSSCDRARFVRYEKIPAVARIAMRCGVAFNDLGLSHGSVHKFSVSGPKDRVEKFNNLVAAELGSIE